MDRVLDPALDVDYGTLRVPFVQWSVQLFSSDAERASSAARQPRPAEPRMKPEFPSRPGPAFGGKLNSCDLLRRCGVNVRGQFYQKMEDIMYLGHWIASMTSATRRWCLMYSSPIYAARPQLPTLVIEQLTEDAVGRLAIGQSARAPAKPAGRKPIDPISSPAGGGESGRSGTMAPGQRPRPAQGGCPSCGCATTCS
jgi:hypothetical protein